MATKEIVADVVFDGDEQWIIVCEADLATLKQSIKSEKDPDIKRMLSERAKWLEDARKTNADKVATCTIVYRVPTPEDRTEIRSASRDANGVYDAEREPLEACKRLVESWTKAGEKQEGQLPICLMDRFYGEAYRYLYPSQVRLAFFAQ
jgi:hypothetical protein